MSADLLGEVVTWDLEGAEVAYTEVQDCLRDAGLNPDDVKEIGYAAAFGRACKDLKKDRAIDKLKRMKGGLLRFQFTRKHLDDNKVEYGYECMVELDDTGNVSCPENPGSREPDGGQGSTTVFRVGKKAAGRLLDEREWTVYSVAGGDRVASIPVT